MADEQIQTTDEQEVAIVPTIQDLAFGADDSAAIPPKVEVNKDDIQPVIKNGDEVVLGNAEWLKKEFEVDSIDIIKQERAELKELRTKTTPSFEFKNEDSRKMAEYLNEGKTDELLSFLDTQKRLDKLLKADLSDKNVAAELVKFGIQKDNPTLSAEDVDFLFNQKYSTPLKPIKGEMEEDTEFDARMDNWKAQVNSIERGLVIEAKMAQPKMAQLKSELILPTIQKDANVQAKQPTQEDLAAAKQVQDSFLQIAEQSISGFKGFNVQVKDKDVDYNVSYSPSEDGKKLITGAVKKFAESNFDANAVFAERWINKDGKTLNTDLMIKDLSRIYDAENIDRKFATDSGNKRIEAYLKEKKQVNVTQQNTTKTFSPSKVEQLDNVREQAFA